jgi:DNA-binding MarR family transcriptional regulator
MAGTHQETLHRRTGVGRAESLSATASAGPLLMARLFVSIDTLFSQLRREAGLGPNERVAVECLWEFGAMPMSELADRTAVTRAAVTTLVDRLEKTGIVSRDGDLNDRRRTIVQLGQAGHDLCASTTRIWMEALGEVFDGLPPATWAQVGPLLGQLYETTRATTNEARGLAASST